MAEIPLTHLAEFKDLFSGNAHNYGVHKYAFTSEGKEQGTNKTETGKMVTVEQYKAHLEGKVGLGIIPLDEQGNCKFGVIDVDVYDADLNRYLRAIERNNFPLVPFKSKSGGLHIYLFLKKPSNAKAVVDLMHDISVLLGLDMYVKKKLNRIIEVFPKQMKVSEKGVGNWINLPYYNADKTRQHAIVNGKALTFDQALMHIKERQRSLSDVRSFLNDLDVQDGPPCLQTIALLNEPSGKNSGRNMYLFSLGVYWKKKNPDIWEMKIYEANNALEAPLGKEEVEGTIVNSLRKKDYSYKCFETPCVDFCRRPLCKTREFGIGKEGGYFSELEYGKLRQIKGDEPYYEWQVKVQGDGADFKLLRFRSEDEIIKQDAFLRLCFRELKLLPIKMKQSEWFKLINQALTEMEVVMVEAADDTSPLSLFRGLFMDFLVNRAMAQTKDQILTKRVFLDAKTARYYFRTVDLSDFIFVAKGFKYYAPGRLHELLHDLGARPTRIKTETGKQFRVYEITRGDVEKVSLIDDKPFEAEFKKEEDF